MVPYICSDTITRPSPTPPRWRPWKYALSPHSKWPIPTRPLSTEMNESESDQPAENANQRDSTRSTASKSDASVGGIIRAALRRFGLVRDGEAGFRDALDEIIEEAGNENEP